MRGDSAQDRYEALLRFSSKYKLRQRLSFLLILFAIFFGGLTFFTIGSMSNFGLKSFWFVILLVFDVIIFFSLVILIARKIVVVWMRRRKGLEGSRLHARMTLIFGAFSILPSIIMIIFSIFSFHFGVHGWFAAKVEKSVEESLEVARGYLKEHENLMGRDASLMARDIEQSLVYLLRNPDEFNAILTLMASMRSFTEAITFDRRQNRIVSRSDLTFALEFEPIPDWAIEKSDNGEVAIIKSKYHDRLRALIKLRGINQVYLFVGRAVDPQVLRHLRETEAAVSEYQILKNYRYEIEFFIVLAFSLVSLLVILLSIWGGLVVAGYVVRPIESLIIAAKKIGQGDYTAKVDEGDSRDEFGSLNRTFNEMSYQLLSNRQALLEINQKLNERKRFMESTLAGVSSGVIGLDDNGIIHVANRFAIRLLNIDENMAIGSPLAKVAPEFSEFLGQVYEHKKGISQSQVMLTRDGKSVTIVLSISYEKNGGIVVTFDDISDLITAQKLAAWSDVARRIAHEMKNPLTPIQLSAERLKRKFLPTIGDHQKLFEECIETIVRQVNIIGDMVSEFSSFARLPEMKTQKVDIVALCKEVVFLQKSVTEDTKIHFKCLEKQINISCDAQQISQVLLNLLKNALEALQDKKAGLGIIHLRVKKEGENLVIEVADNGPGIRQDILSSIFEPYVTTKKQGTGLGLSIVRKIIDDHRAQISAFVDPELKGSCFQITFPKVW